MLDSLLTYTQPQIKKYSSGVYVEYYTLNPLTKKLERHLEKANRVIKRAGSKREGMKLLQAYCIELSGKLASGWSPYLVTTENSRLLTPLHKALNKFLSDKCKDLRPDTLRTYKTVVNKLLLFTSQNSLCMDINKMYALNFMATLQEIAPRTYNNNLKQCRIIFEYLKDNCYIEKNPFAELKPKKVYEKKRTVVSADYRKLITDYLYKNDRPFLLFLHLIFTSLIRPKEIRNIRLQDINIAGKYIRIAGESAKNHKERLAPISPDIVALLPDLSLPANYYLFSNGLKCGRKAVSKTIFNRHWKKLKTALELPDNVQMYSFRDSGIFEMLKSGIDDLTVMQAADHSSLQITSIYAKHIDTSLQEKLFNTSPSF